MSPHGPVDLTQHGPTVFGVQISSRVPLRWADRSGILDPSQRAITVEAVSTVLRASMRDRPIAAGEDACRLERLDDGRLLADTADAGPFVLDCARYRIEAPTETVNDPEWEHRLLAYALPYFLGELGMLVLHAAAVDTADGVVLMLGPSGRGKSTLTVAAIDAGYRVLGDDGVRITPDPNDPRRLLAWPGLIAARSVRHNATGRAVGKDTREMPAFARCAQPRPVVGIVALMERTTHGSPLAHLGPRDRVGAILQSTFADCDAVARVFPAVASLARAVPVAKVSVRDDRSVVTAELERILAVAHEAAPPAYSFAGSPR